MKGPLWGEMNTMSVSPGAPMILQCPASLPPVSRQSPARGVHSSRRLQGLAQSFGENMIVASLLLRRGYLILTIPATREG